MHVAAVLLAAGASRRFGAPKLLLSVDGQPLAGRTARVLLEGGADSLVVVLGARADEVEAAVVATLAGGRAAGAAPSVTFVRNEAWDGGMFGSVRLGLAASSAEAERFAVSPADLPGLEAEDVARVLGTARVAPGEALVVAAHAGGGAPEVRGEAGRARVDDGRLRPDDRRARRGHPLVLSRLDRDRVLAWPASRRLSELLSEPGVVVVEVPCGEGVVHDVDVPTDLAARPA